MCGEYKFWRDISGARSPSPATGTPVQDSSDRKISPHTFWLQNLVETELVEITSGVPSSSPWRTPIQTYLDSLLLSASTWETAWKAPVACREELECLASRQELGTASSQTERWAEAIVPFLNPPSTEPQSWQAGTISETPSTWPALFVCSTQLAGPPKLWIGTFPYEWLVLALASQLPKSYQIRIADFNEPPGTIPLVKWPQAWH